MRIFLDSSMKPSHSVCQFGNIKQDFGEENTKPGSLVAQSGIVLGQVQASEDTNCAWNLDGIVVAGVSTLSKHCKGTLKQSTKAPNAGVHAAWFIAVETGSSIRDPTRDEAKICIFLHQAC